MKVPGVRPRTEETFRVALVNLAISSVSVIAVTEIPQAGRPFEVQVQSYGLDGCWVADRAVVDLNESTPSLRFRTALRSPSRRQGKSRSWCAHPISRRASR
jgi:hypothetical protein